MTPDPVYLYSGRTHGEALASLSLGIADNRGFFALIAEPGMGKTTLLYQLLEDLRDSTRTVLVSQTQCNPREFIEYILQGLGVDVNGMGLVAMHGVLNEILFEELLAGKRFVLVVDEAQNLDDSVLETVRMLSNFETHNTKLLQIILAGQSPLAAKLSQPGLSQLRQRIAVLTHLEPFTVEETGHYIEHRLKVAGYSGEPIFDAASVRLIARHSKGVPRNINNLCYTSLLLASIRSLRTVTLETVQEAIKRLDMESLAPEPLAIPDSAAAPVVATAVAAPVASAAGSGASRPRPVQMTPANKKDRPPNGYLTYDAGRKITRPNWPVRSAILAVVLLSGPLLLAILGRSESGRAMTSSIFHRSTRALSPQVFADQSEGAIEKYDAEPRDAQGGQVLTVMAGPQQTLKELSLRYLGHFDSDLSKKICSLNPDLEDPDHLEAGQLIRIPLPPGAMKKANDTADAAPSLSETSENLIAKFSAFLHGRKYRQQEQ